MKSKATDVKLRISSLIDFFYFFFSTKASILLNGLRHLHWIIVLTYAFLISWSSYNFL